MLANHLGVVRGRDAQAAQIWPFAGTSTTPLIVGCLLTDHAHSGEDWPDLLKLAGQRGFAVKSA
jgi:hypothetical protein